MIEAQHFKTIVIESLAHKLSDYLKSDKGRIAILNPPGRPNIGAISIYSFYSEIVFRINIGINRWCEGEDVLAVIKDIECEMKNLLSDIELMFHNIEEDITGFARSIYDVSFRVFPRSALYNNFMSNAMSLTDRIRMIFGRPSLRNVYRQFTRERRAKAIYDEWLLSFTYEHIRDIFEENFGTEYDKVISRIFKVEIPQKLDGFTLTIDKLLNELSDSKIKKKSFTQLKKIVQDMRKNIEDFNRLMTEEYFV